MQTLRLRFAALRKSGTQGRPVPHPAGRSGTGRGLRCLIGGLWLGLTVPAWADGTAQIQWSGEKLSVSAEGMPLQELLEKVAVKTGVHLDLVGTFPEPVKVAFEGAPLRQGLVEILETAGVSYAIVEYFDPKMEAQTIALSISKKGPASGQPGAASPAVSPYGAARGGQGPGESSGNTPPPAQPAPAPAVARPATGTGERGASPTPVPVQRSGTPSTYARPSTAAPRAPGMGQPAPQAAPSSSFGTVTPFSIKPFETTPSTGSSSTNNR